MPVYINVVQGFLCLVPLVYLFVNGDHSPIFPQVASLYQRWLEKRLFSDKRL